MDSNFLLLKGTSLISVQEHNMIFEFRQIINIMYLLQHKDICSPSKNARRHITELTNSCHLTFLESA